MKKRTAFLGAILSLMPLGQPLFFKTGIFLMTGLMISVPEKAYAKSAYFYYNRGISKYESEDYNGAIADYTKAIEKKPKFDNAYFNRGVAKDALGDYYGAISDYTKSIELKPQMADAYYSRGNSKSNLKDYSGAIADYTKAIEINPKYLNAYTNRGIDKEKIKDIKGACADWRKASELGYEDATKWVKDQCRKYK